MIERGVQVQALRQDVHACACARAARALARAATGQQFLTEPSAEAFKLLVYEALRHPQAQVNNTSKGLKHSLDRVLMEP